MKRYIITLLAFLPMISMGWIGPFPGGTGGGGSGTVTSVGMSVPSFLSVSGSPVTTSGTLAVTLNGSSIPVSSGGTGATTASAAINNLLPDQVSANGKYLTSNGTSASWGTITAVSGPGSSVDGDIATWNGTGGNTLRSEAKFNVNATTGAITKTFAGGPTTLDSMDIGTATTWTQARLVTGTSNNTPSTGYIDRYNFTFDIGSTNRNFHITNLAPTISGSTSGLIAREYASIIGVSSGASAGGQFATLSGVVGNFNAMYNTNSTGLGIAHYGWMNANKAVGARGLAYAGQGSSGRAIGVNGVATTENNPSIASAGYFAMDSTISDGGAETDTAFPATSGVLIANTGDVAATIPAFIAMNNGSSVFQVQNNGRTVIGGNGGTARHELNTATQAAGSATGTLGTQFPTNAAPYAFVRMMVNGREVYFPVWATP